MITELLIAACLSGSPTWVVTNDSWRDTGLTASFNKETNGAPIIFDLSGAMIKGADGKLVPIVDNSYDIGKSVKTKTFLKIGGKRYVQLQVAVLFSIGIVIGTVIGGFLGARRAIKDFWTK